jgi:hypothetical protein
LREFEEREISRQSCRGDCEEQGGKLLKLLSRFRPRIWPQETKVVVPESYQPMINFVLLRVISRQTLEVGWGGGGAEGGSGEGESVDG